MTGTGLAIPTAVKHASSMAAANPAKLETSSCGQLMPQRLELCIITPGLQHKAIILDKKLQCSANALS